MADARGSRACGYPALLERPPDVAARRELPGNQRSGVAYVVQQNELAPDKIEIFQRDTLGQHTTMLVGLAVEANRVANTVISDSNANRTISNVVRRLAEDGQIQIGVALQPRTIVDGLVATHLLVRAAGTDGAISFQHQLFQEWYAAAEVEELMLQAAAGDAKARKRLREDVLNWPAWEESILFACDRVSRASDRGVRAVAAAVEDALRIDPILAAAMLDRAADAVWLRVQELVMRFVDRWHTPGKVDRAVRFMVASGKPEFADRIWPLVSNADDQLQFKTFQASDRFRPRVLGPECDARLRALPAPQRKGFDGMELAATLAADDPDPEVVVAVVESLAFRRGDRQVDRVMQVAPDAVWKALGKESYPYHLADSRLDARLAAERSASRAVEPDPVRLLGRIAEERPAK
jgi:hypothetical protein